MFGQDWTYMVTFMLIGGTWTVAIRSLRALNNMEHFGNLMNHSFHFKMLDGVRKRQVTSIIV
jgi:hypothetical protein